MATHSSTLAWKTPRTEEFYSLQSMESPRFWHDWLLHFFQFSSSSVAQLCPTLCDPMNCSTPGLPVHHQLLELIQTHVHWVGDAIQPSHRVSSPSPPAPNPSQHQGLCQWVNSSLLYEEWKLTFSSTVTTTEFSKFAGILSATHSQHHLLGFEIAQLEFHHLH